MKANARVVQWCSLLLLAGCVSTVPQPGGGGRGGRGGGGAGGGAIVPQRDRSTVPVDFSRAWPVRSAEHIDLWFHGFAMLTQDTARVPYFTRGYRDQMVETRRQRSVYSSLDADREVLSARFPANPALNGAQFVIFNFESFEELSRAVDVFLRAEGSPGAIQDPAQRPMAQALADYFRSVADRNWLRTFMAALQDERARFYTAYWTSERSNRSAVFNAVETMWTQTYRTKFQRFLTNTRHADGSFLLSLPIGGEGRTVFSTDGNAIAVPFPPTVDRAIESIYVFAHEAVSTIVEPALTDNLTPAQTRAHEGDKYVAAAAVRGGALLIQRISPDDAQGYMKYYLHAAGLTVPDGDVSAAFTAAFALPDAVQEGIRRQIEAVLAGI